MPSLISKVPFLGIPDTPLIATTQDELPIAEIVDNIVLYKNGGSAIVMESTSLNFGLLSEREQEAVIASYAGLINSLSFSIQIVVKTLRKDISQYLQYLEESKMKITNEKLKMLMQGYQDFISETIKKKNVLGKRFFLVIPFSALELGVTKSLQTSATRTKTLPYTRDYALRKAKVALYPRRDHIIKQGNRLGLKLTQLTNEQLIELYYEIFNPKVQPVQDEGQL
jgi:hypothetical protein